MSLYQALLPMLQEIREHFGPALEDSSAPWGGTLDEWLDFFVQKIDQIDEDLCDEEVEEFSESSVQWVRQKYGAKKAQAHREFLKMVRKDPAAHRRKMREDKLYHKKHKWHDKIMQRTARSGWRRSRHEGLEERDPGQSFMDLPFELRVTAVEAATDSGKEMTDKERSRAALAASKKTGKDVPEHYLKECSMDAFYRNTHYFYRVKGQEWEGSKKAKVQRAVAASYSALKKSCGVDSKEDMTPSEIVKKGGGEPGVRGRKE